MHHRLLTPDLVAALADTPAVLVAGPRQAGKSTLAQFVAAGAHPADYVTLDSATTLAAALRDPEGFVTGLTTPVVLDEVQRAPELFRALKLAIDRDRQPGRYLLTGSANVFVLPRLSESLAGRMEVLRLYPLAQAEIEGTAGRFIDVLFGDRLPVTVPDAGGAADLAARIARGGYPEAVARPDVRRRDAFFGSYLTTILQRDVRDLSDVAGLDALPHLLTLLATRTAALLNVADLSREVGLPRTTLDRYLPLLEHTYLVYTIPAWHGNLGKRLVKAPKVLLGDTGLATSLLHMTPERMLAVREYLGPFAEAFAALELMKLASWSRTQPRLFHYRTHTGQEVDLVLEAPDGRLVGVEVKSSASVSAADLKGLQGLREATGSRWHRGVVLYTGSAVVPFNAQLHAVPFSALWAW